MKVLLGISPGLLSILYNNGLGKVISVLVLPTILVSYIQPFLAVRVFFRKVYFHTMITVLLSMTLKNKKMCDTSIIITSIILNYQQRINTPSLTDNTLRQRTAAAHLLCFMTYIIQSTNKSTIS
jgi:hypothetical protein